MTMLAESHEYPTVLRIFFDNLKAEEGGVKRFGALDIPYAEQDMTKAFECDHRFPHLRP
jgi:hypothetical protein